MTAEDDTLADIVRAVDPEAELLGAETLKGGVSAWVRALDVRTPRGAERWVLRTLPDDPDLDGATEYALLRWLEDHAFPVAPVIAAIPPSPEHPVGAVLMEFVEGRILEQPDRAHIEHLGALLAHLHRMPIASLDFLPDLRAPALPDHWTHLPPERMRLLAECSRTHPPVPSGAPVLCHGDFWCGNLLWRSDDMDDGVVVLDWEEAGVGDRLHDLAVARLEMIWQTGVDQMNWLTDAYLAAATTRPSGGISSRGQCRFPSDGGHGNDERKETRNALVTSHPDLDAEHLRTLLAAHDLRATLCRLSWLPTWGLPDATRDGCLAVGLAHAERCAAALSN